jgi:hypothetical protein
VDEPVCNIESSTCGIKIAGIENKEIFCAWICEALDCMTLSLWEVPDISFVGSEYLVLAFVAYCRNLDILLVQTSILINGNLQGQTQQ